MPYVEYTWENLPNVTTPISKANLDHLEEQYDEADAELTTHEATPHIKSGIIVMWHGTIGNIPAGYLICDGNNATPNLLTRFVQGVATAATDPGATGGAATHTLITAESPSHNHGGPTVLGPGAGSYHFDTGALNDNVMTSSGGGGAHQNEPLFYDIAFLMKS